MLVKKPGWILLISTAILVIFGLIILELRSGPNAINASDCITFKVGLGIVFEPVVATGTVEAENEVLIRCPYTSIVKQIIAEPGTRVQKGDVIMLMEDESIRDEIGKIKDQLELKRNTL